MFQVHRCILNNELEIAEQWAEVYEPYEFQDEQGNVIEEAPDEMPAKVLCRYLGFRVKEEG